MEFLLVLFLLWPENPPESLGLLSSRAEQRAELDGHVGIWQVNADIPYPGYKEDIPVVQVLEVLDYSVPLELADLPRYVRRLEPFGILHQDLHQIDKNKNFISLGFMDFDQIFQNREFIWIGRVKCESLLG